MPRRTGGPSSPRCGPGPFWLTSPRVAPATGARLWADRADGGTIAMGEEAPATRCAVRVRLPQRAEVRIVHDGAVLHEASAANVDLAIGKPGVYRAEARIGGRFWLMSNPIHLRSGPGEDVGPRSRGAAG